MKNVVESKNEETDQCLRVIGCELARVERRQVSFEINATNSGPGYLELNSAFSSSLDRFIENVCHPEDENRFHAK